MAESRWSLTSSERRGVIALAVVLLILIILTGLSNGVWRPTVESAGTLCDTVTTFSAATPVNALQLADDTVNAKSRHRKKQRKARTNKPKTPRATTRSHLDEAIDAPEQRPVGAGQKFGNEAESE